MTQISNRADHLPIMWLIDRFRPPSKVGNQLMVASMDHKPTRPLTVVII